MKEDLYSIDKKILIRFALINDIHFSSSLENITSDYYKKALTGLNEYTNNGLDAVVVHGDFSEGYREDYDTLINITKELVGDTPLIASYGNHEGDGKHYQYEDAFHLPVDNVCTVKDFKFVTLVAHAGNTYTDEQAKWVDEKLTEIEAFDPNKPIFTLMHYPLSGIYTEEDKSNHCKNLLPIFKKNKMPLFYVLMIMHHLAKILYIKETLFQLIIVYYKTLLKDNFA